MALGSHLPRPRRLVTASSSALGPGSARLLERESALDLLAAETDRAMSGSGRLVLFRAPTGTGRSALLEAAAERGAKLGMRVLRAHASAERSGLPLALVGQLLNAPTGLGDLHNTPEDPDHLSDSARLWRLLCEHAAASPLLVAVDDAHLADQASRCWLTEAARRLAGMPVLMVVTERGQYDIAPPTPGLAYSLPPGVVRMHAVAPLSRPAAEELVRGVLGADTSDTWVDGCVRAGAGNPLLLRSLLDDLRAVFPYRSPESGGPEPRLPESSAELYPGAFVAAVSWWLKSTGPGSTKVARALAELEDSAPERNGEGRKEQGDHGPLPCGPGLPGLRPGSGAHTEPGPCHDFDDFLAELTGADPDRVSGWVTAMIRLGLLHRAPGTGIPRFAHPLLRGAVLDGWPRSHRQALHHRAAELRQRRGDGAEAVAGHLLRTSPVDAAGGTASVDQALRAAAADATRAGRTATAALYLRRALDEPLPRERRSAVLTELGELEFATLRTGGIPRLAEALRLQERPRDRVLAAVNLGNALANRGKPHAALDVLRDLGPLDADPVLARTVQTASAFFSDHDPEIRRAVYTRLSERAEHSPEWFSPALRALLIRYRAAAGLLSADSAVRQIRRLLTAPEDPLLVPYLLATAAAVAQCADAPDEAERLIRTGLTEHVLTPLHPVHRSLLNTRVETAAARGQYQWVLEETAGRLRTPADAALAGASNFLAQRVIALVECDRSAEAERLIAGIDVADAQDSWELNRFLYARGVLRASVGDQAGALADFRECGRRQLGRDVVSIVVTPWRSAAAECHLLLGETPQALALAEEESRYAAVWGTPRVLGRALRVLGAATGGRRGLELTAEAVGILRGTSLDVELIPALIAHGRQLTASGQPRQARPLLREAATTAERLGAVRLSGTAERALRASGTRRWNTSLTGPSSLTAGERRIAALAADGRTNAEISQLLHLALRTVETHLTSTYRKLGIRRRGDLPAVLNSGTKESG
ncbi:LuxR C-terminal-related transcriptional regulator [Streptomyces fildesensis]|uniref:LuxR C-terminal-related transcriptional regulator n=1 Tax=Streptomyces fildesensis TaxID=375757 RepID=A0ABW8C514_9ACTN